MISSLNTVGSLPPHKNHHASTSSLNYAVWLPPQENHNASSLEWKPTLRFAKPTLPLYIWRPQLLWSASRRDGKGTKRFKLNWRLEKTKCVFRQVKNIFSLNMIFMISYWYSNIILWFLFTQKYNIIFGDWHIMNNVILYTIS